MRKKVIGALLCTAMVASVLGGCGSKEEAKKDNSASNAASSSSDAGSDADSGSALKSDGKVLNVYCWNDEFQRRVKAHYPGYEEVDASTGKIGDVTVKWNSTPSTDNAYQNNLDTALQKQADAAADDKIDIFLVEADYALKYINTDYAASIADLGITEDDMKNQYKYTRDIVTDSNGVQKGISWQGCPGVMFYNREIDKEVLDTDDTAKIQEAVADWDKFNETAQKIVDAGYSMTSSVNDTYRVYSNNVSSRWVEDGKISIDENIMKWVEDSKKLYDEKAIKSTADILSDDWKTCVYPEGKVFCCFGPAWMINFCMAADEEGSVANAGGWAATEGPQGFYWGGTWICATSDTDNADLIKDIMLKLTCDETIMTDIVKDDDDFVNNKPAMEAMGQSDYSSKVLGGQNPLPMYCAGADKISLENVSPYDQGCTEEFQKAMKDYFEGNADLDTCLDTFYTAITVKYPELTR